MVQIKSTLFEEFQETAARTNPAFRVMSEILLVRHDASVRATKIFFVRLDQHR